MERKPPESRLERARRHVAEGEARIERVKSRIAETLSRGGDAYMHQQTLEVFESMLEEWKATLADLERGRLR